MSFAYFFHADVKFYIPAGHKNKSSQGAYERGHTKGKSDNYHNERRIPLHKRKADR